MNHHPDPHAVSTLPCRDLGPPRMPGRRRAMVMGVLSLWALSVTAPAWGQGRGPGRDDRNDRNDRNDREGTQRGRMDPAQPSRGPQGRGLGPPERNGPRWDGRQALPPGRGEDGRRGAGPDRDMRRGSRLPPRYRGRGWVVDDWRGHRLSAPPRGTQWVQVGADYVLVAIATGLIIQLMLDH